MELELAGGREKANEIKDYACLKVLRYCDRTADVVDLDAIAALAELAVELGLNAIGPFRMKDLLLQLAFMLPGMPEAYDPDLIPCEADALRKIMRSCL